MPFLLALVIGNEIYQWKRHIEVSQAVMFVDADVFELMCLRISTFKFDIVVVDIC